MAKHPTPHFTMGRKLAVVTVAAAALALAPASLALADSGKPAPVTPATGFHGLPGNNGGHSDQAKGAAPVGAGRAGGDGGIHGIGTNPGQSGVAPGERDTPPSCDMHGGLDAANRNCG
jgi:hypothetical protein